MISTVLIANGVIVTMANLFVPTLTKIAGLHQKDFAYANIINQFIQKTILIKKYEK